MNIVVITGATKGLGLSICEALVASNYHVIGIARHITDDFKSLQQLWPSTLSFETFDLLESNNIHQLCTKITKEYGRIYGLINNAALGNDGVLATMHETEISDMLTVNVQAPLLLSKYFVRSMLINQRGRIVNISSIIASTGYSGLAVYGATKAALSGFTKSLSREVGKANITVNTIAPGFMETAMTANLDNEKLDKIKRRSPLNRLAESGDVAQAVVYLLSDNAKSITGSTITIDAGSTA